MTEAPKEVWLETEYGTAEWPNPNDPDYTHYTRTDTIPTWQPVTDTHKDGTVYRGFFPDWVDSDKSLGLAAPGQVETYWYGTLEDGVWITKGKSSTVEYEPSHVMPLPPAPEEG